MLIILLGFQKDLKKGVKRWRYSLLIDNNQNQRSKSSRLFVEKSWPLHKPAEVRNDSEGEPSRHPPESRKSIVATARHFS
jgi:hypothetical protein